MTVLNTGSNKKFSAGWEGIFGKEPAKKAKSTTAKKSAKKSAAKKSAPRAMKK